MERSWRTEVLAGDDGPRLVKRALDEDGRTVLAREAERLARAAHPGVVEVLSHHPNELELAWAGDATLATRVPPLAVSAAILAAVAATVADLHGIGVVHGRLDPSHVVIDAEGCPRLCGFGPSATSAPVEPGPADDVAAVGRLVLHLVGPEAELEPIPEHRWRRRRWAGYQRRALQMLADQATQEDPARRPTAKALAGLIAECVPDAHLAPPDPDRTSDGPSHGTAVPAGPASITETAETAEQPTTSAAEPDGRDEARPAPDDSSDPAVPPRSLTWQTLVAHRVDSLTRDHPEDLEPDPDRDVTEPNDHDGAADRTGTSGHRPGPAVSHVLGLPVLPSSAATSGEERARPGRAVPPTPRPVAEGAGMVWVRRAAILVLLTATVVTAVRLRGPDGSAIASPPDRAAPPVATSGSASTTTEADPDPTVTTPVLAANGPAERSAGTSGPAAAPAVRHAGVTYLVGNPGDHAVVADWDCDGAATVGLVRPATGEVFLFADWAAPEHELTVEPAEVIPGAVALRVPPAVDGSDLCPPVTVELADGALYHLMPPGRP